MTKNSDKPEFGAAFTPPVEYRFINGVLHQRLIGQWVLTTSVAGVETVQKTSEGLWVECLEVTDEIIDKVFWDDLGRRVHCPQGRKGDG